MSQKCPECGLFNPPDAGRCDCGYDFVSKSVKSSYLLAHVLEKRGGEARIIDEMSRSKIRTGILLLVLSALVTGVSLRGGSNGYFWGGATMVGALLLYRGLRQRGRQTLDSEARRELMR
jgi:hypothetical protein